MLKTILQALVGALISLATGWLAKRRTAKAEEARATNQAKATNDASAMRDSTDRDLEDSHVATDMDRIAVRDDTGHPDGLREQSAIAQRAIDRANGAVQ